MALVSVNTYSTTNRRWGRAAITNEPNMRASHTMAVRVKHSSTLTNYDSAILFYGNAGITSGSAVTRNQSGLTSTQVNTYRATGTSGQAAYGTAYGNTTTWYHLCFVYNATTQFIRFYIDGTFVGQAASTATDATNATGDFFVAQHPGSFCDAALYNRALTDPEVASLAGYRTPQVTSGLLAYWRLDSDGSDISGNAQTSAQLGSAGTNLTFNGDTPPQPENPPIVITPTASASTTGTAAMTAVRFLGCNGSAATTGTVAMTVTKALGACNGTTSTAGSAVVLKSNVVPVGTDKGFGIADLVRVGGQAYRWPSTNGFYNSTFSDPAPAPGGAITTMAWVRARDNAPLDQSGGAVRTAFLQVIANPSTSWALDILVSPNNSTGATVSAAAFANGSGLGQRDGSVDFNWHHVAVTYSGAGIVKLWIDGVQSGADLSVTLPANDTDIYFNIAEFSNTVVLVDTAHWKTWIGKALNSTEIGNEIASYRPVTDVFGTLRAYYPMLWDNPNWEAWDGNDLNSAMIYSGDDAPNGPPGTWGNSSATGNTSTSGSATVSRVLSFGACNGATSTTGSATSGWNYAQSANGASSTTGNAGLLRALSVNSSTTTTGNVGVSVTYDFASTGGPARTTGSAATAASSSLISTASTQTSGTAAAAASAGLVINGPSSTTGSAATAWNFSQVASGSNSTKGDAGLNPILSGNGSSQTSGTAALTVAAGLVANGPSATSGVVVNAGSVPANGVTQTSGSAFFSAITTPVDGLNRTSGSAVTLIEIPIATNGDPARTSGTVVMTATAGLVASGQATTSGSTQFNLFVNGVSQTSGAVTLSALKDLVASGPASTTGSAALLFASSVNGQNTTSGTATMTAAAQLIANGNTVTNGSAVFAGVAPPGGSGAAGALDVQRRSAAFEAGRRRIR